jgi:DNA-binding CsgD family transcriptional regulator
MTYIPTETEMRHLRAYLDAGTCKQAAELMGLSEQAVKQTLWRMRLKARVNSTEQLVFLFHSELRTMGVTR